MAKDSIIKAAVRTEKGTTNVRRLRRTGMIPGIINNDKCESAAISINQHDFSLMLHHHASERLILDIEIDKSPAKKVLLREVQRDPVSGEPIHAEFIELSMTKKMKVKIPVVLKGEPFGVTQEGGVMEQLTREVEVECLPVDLIETFVVDVTSMKMGQMWSVGTIDAGSKITILTDKTLALVTVLEPRKEDEVSPEAAAAAEAAAGPEVIGEKEREEKAKTKGKEEGKGAAPEAGGKKEPAKKDEPKKEAKKEAKK